MFDSQAEISNTKIEVEYIAIDAANETSNNQITRVHSNLKAPPKNRLLSADTVLPQLVGK